jgi:hypothetical protein
MYCTAETIQCQQVFSTIFTFLFLLRSVCACMYYALLESFRQHLFATVTSCYTQRFSGCVLVGLINGCEAKNSGCIGTQSCYNTYMNTQTPLQAVVLANLNGRQKNSLRALQAKVEQPCSYATTRVSDAQMRAMQAAYDAAKASGLPLAPELLAAAKVLGLK